MKDNMVVEKGTKMVLGVSLALLLFLSNTPAAWASTQKSCVISKAEDIAILSGENEFQQKCPGGRVYVKGMIELDAPLLINVEGARILPHPDYCQFGDPERECGFELSKNWPFVTPFVQLGGENNLIMGLSFQNERGSGGVKILKNPNRFIDNTIRLEGGSYNAYNSGIMVDQAIIPKGDPTFVIPFDRYMAPKDGKEGVYVYTSALKEKGLFNKYVLDLACTNFIKVGDFGITYPFDPYSYLKDIFDMYNVEDKYIFTNLDTNGNSLDDYAELWELPYTWFCPVWLEYRTWVEYFMLLEENCEGSGGRWDLSNWGDIANAPTSTSDPTTLLSSMCDCNYNNDNNGDGFKISPNGVCVKCGSGHVVNGSDECVKGCRTRNDCATGRICKISKGTTYGECSACKNDDDCEKGEVCNKTTGKCEQLKACSSDAECDSGYFCKKDSGSETGVCTKKECETLLDCKDGYYCDTSTFECKLGKPCEDDSNCDQGKGEWCREDPDLKMKVCKKISCISHENCALIQTGTACIDGWCMPCSSLSPVNWVCPGGDEAAGGEKGSCKGGEDPLCPVNSAPIEACGNICVCKTGYYSDQTGKACYNAITDLVCPLNQTLDLETQTCVKKSESTKKRGWCSLVR